MKRAFLTLLFIFCMAVSLVFSLDLELIGGLGNLSHNKSRTAALSNEDDPGRFDPNYHTLSLVRVSGEFSGIGFNAGYENDPVVRRNMFANAKIEKEYFSLEAGPFLSVFNSRKLWLSPGLSAGLGLAVPGKVFGKVKGASTLGVPMDIRGNFSVNSGEISLGFWVPHVICSLNTSFRNFTIREQANLLVEDELNRYFFRADVFTKNIPYTMRLDLGYQSLSRSYISQKVSGSDIVKNSDKDEFKSVFLGLEGTFSLNESLKLVLGGEMAVYSWGVRPMRDPSKNTMLFQARAGVIYSIIKEESYETN